MKYPDQGDFGTETPLEFAQRNGLPIKNNLLLSRALTHRSFLNEHPEALEDNERLEFLGDAVLDFLVGAWLYKHYPEMSEGELTRMRSALVRTEQLAGFAKHLDLGAAMRLGRGERLAGGREREALLCATFEALIGSMYLDAGLSVVEEFIEPFLEQAAQVTIAAQTDRDPKSVLQEMVQARGKDTPNYRTVSASGPDHQKTFEVEVLIDGQVFGRGVGHSKQAAAKAAARVALRNIKETN